MANQFLALSLFIMLLSFFIILNAYSTFEVTKAKPVLNSIASVFSQEDIREVTPPGEEESFEQSSRKGSVLSQIEALFTAEIAGVEARQNRLGTEMMLRLPMAEFEKKIEGALSLPEAQNSAPDQDQNFMRLLVSVLDTQQARPYRMDMILGTGQSPVALEKENPQEFVKANMKITDIAYKLEQAGMPARFMSAGLDNGPEDMVVLFFRRHEVFNPLGSDNAGGRR